MTLTEEVARAIAKGAGLDWDNIPNSNYDNVVVGQVTRLGLMNGAREAILMVSGLSGRWFK